MTTAILVTSGQARPAKELPCLNCEQMVTALSHKVLEWVVASQRLITDRHMLHGLQYFFIFSFHAFPKIFYEQSQSSNVAK